MTEDWHTWPLAHKTIEALPTLLGTQKRLTPSLLRFFKNQGLMHINYQGFTHACTCKPAEINPENH